MIDTTGMRDNRLGNPVLTEYEIRLKFELTQNFSNVTNHTMEITYKV